MTDPVLCSLLFVVALLFGVVQGKDYLYDEDEGVASSEFILDPSIARVLTSTAGEIRSIVGSAEENRPLWEHDVALGLITMEPKALLLPQYMDAASVFFVQQGEALVKWIRKGNVASKNIKAGDVFSMPGGAVFYLLNIDEQQSLKILGMMDTSSSYKRGRPQHFFVGGGIDPKVVLSGFAPDTLAAAFKVSREEIVHFFSSQHKGPIIQTTVQLSGESMNQGKSKSEGKDEQTDDKQHKDSSHEENINLFEKPSFANSYGWTSTTSRTGLRFEVSVVHLKPSTMHAPHWSSRGSTFGVVTKGSGTFQIAFANGTNAAEETLEAGSVFYVPQFLPASQIAAAEFPLEYVSFTLVSRGMEANDELHFLAGYESVLQKLDLNIVALSLNVPELLVKSFLNSQQESVILPAAVQRGFADH